MAVVLPKNTDPASSVRTLFFCWDPSSTTFEAKTNNVIIIITKINIFNFKSMRLPS